MAHHCLDLCVQLTSQRYSLSFVSGPWDGIRRGQQDGFQENVRVRKCRFRCVVRVNLAGQWGHSFVWGKMGLFPL
jgi:hypothetical protein